MNPAVRLWLVAIPLFGVGFDYEGRFVSLSYVLAAAVLVTALATSPGTLRAAIFTRGRSQTVGVAAFLALGAVGLLASPFGVNELLPRAVPQMLGLSVISTAAMVAALSSGSPHGLERLLRFYHVVLGVVAILALAQFVSNNIAREDLIDFAFLNVLGPEVWRSPGELGPVYRANSVASEPAHLVRFLGCALGPALMRLGMVSPEYADRMRGVMPLWIAVAIVAALATTVSVLGIALALTTFFCLLWGAARLHIVTFLWWLGLGAFFSLGAVYLGTEHLDELLTKLESVDLLFAPDMVVEDLHASYLSALAISSNRMVAEAVLSAHPWLGAGLGSHALSYAQELPSHLARFMEEIGAYGLNAEDASGLLVRLASETGLVGAGTFIAIFAWPLWRSLALLRSRIKGRPAGPAMQDALALGLGASLAGVMTIGLIRYGAYFDPATWLQLALTQVALLDLARLDASDPRPVRAPSSDAVARLRPGRALR